MPNLSGGFRIWSGRIAWGVAALIVAAVIGGALYQNILQEELTRLSTHSTLVIAKGSGHYIQNDRPDIVIEAVHNVVDQARKSAAPHEYRK
jgi:pimeloyl-ACP methyl ester carboxylesterase